MEDEIELKTSLLNGPKSSVALILLDKYTPDKNSKPRAPFVPTRLANTPNCIELQPIAPNIP